MRRLFISLLLCVISCVAADGKDWLLDGNGFEASVVKSADGREHAPHRLYGRHTCLIIK